VNKNELTAAVAEDLGLTQALARKAVEIVFDEIQSAVADGDKVSIAGFGVFVQHSRPARTGRNPSTGETIQVAASVIPKFRPGAAFRAVVTGRQVALAK
jgi:DNA-binding protein HU-beta